MTRNAYDIVTVQLDTNTEDETVTAWLDRTTAEYPSLEYHVVDFFGPAGGAAVVEYSGLREDVEKFVSDYFVQEPYTESLDFYMGYDLTQE